MWIKLLSDYAGHKAGEVVDVEDSIARAYVAAGKAQEHQAAEESLIRSAVSELQAGYQAAIGELRTEVATELRNLAAGVRPVVRSGEAEADKTKGFGDFCRAVEGVKRRRDQDSMERLTKVYRAGFTDADGNVVRGLEAATAVTGGVLVPEEYASELLRLDAEMPAVADAVRTVPMSGPVKNYPTLRQTGKNPAAAGESQIYAGVRTYRKSEKAQRTASQPEFDWVKLEATDLIAYTESTRDLMADAPGLQSDLFTLFRAAIAWKMDWEFLYGDGVAKPLGMLHASNPCLVTHARAGAGAIAYADVLGMFSKFLPQALAGAYWLANVTVIPQLGTLKDAANNTVWVANHTGGAREDLPGTLLGKPLRFTEKAKALGTAGDLSLVAPRFYLHGLRAGVEIGISEEFLFDTDEVAFRVKLRNDGRPWLKGTYRQGDGANTAVSPFVRLGDAS